MKEPGWGWPGGGKQSAPAILRLLFLARAEFSVFPGNGLGCVAGEGGGDNSASMEITYESGDLGPAMRALPTDEQRRFVVLIVDKPLAPRHDLVIAAGFTAANENVAKVCASRLMRNAAVLAAIREETEKRVQFAGLVGIHGLLEMAQNPEHKRHFAACVALADRGGFPAKTEHKVDVNHSDRLGRTLLERIRTAAERLGLDPAALLGVNTAPMIEGEVVDGETR